MNKLYIKTFLAVSFGAFAIGAKADSTISYTNNIVSTLTDWTNTVALQKFNPALGTLDSISITLNSGFSTMLKVTNTGTSMSSGNSKTDFTINLNSGSYDLFGTGSSYVDEYLSSGFSYSLASHAAATSGMLTKKDSVSNTGITAAGTLSAFTGTGALDFQAWTQTATDLSNSGGNTSSSQVTSANASFIITYDFTPGLAPVPEPSTFAMLGTGLAGLGMVVRRRFSK